ncbi:MAG: hypothetical protein AAFY39_10420 [Pseudomonadota bacterium]
MYSNLRTLIAACVALMAIASPATADRVTVLLGSHHAGASGQYEEFNPGLFYTWEGRRAGWSLGAYRNSYGEISLAGAVARPLVRWDDGELSVFAGIAHYPNDGRRFDTHIGGDVVGLAGVQVRYRNVLVQALPYQEGSAKALLSFGLTFDVGQ